jgi:hypothetical protein
LHTIAADPHHLGATIDFIAILHTWGQNLVHHPHLQCVVPGGGLAPDGSRWVACQPGFFLPVRVLSRLFWRLFLERLEHAFDMRELRFFSSLAPLAERGEFAHYLAGSRHAEWVVYAKVPFGGPPQVLDYLGRYTHHEAIPNNRLVGLTDGHVTFRWKYYRHPDRSRVMRLDAHEFIRRFLLHVLPRGLQRIRHYGLLCNRLRESRLRMCRHLLNVEPTSDTCSAPEPDYRARYAKNSQVARSMTVLCVRAGPCCASSVCYPVHHRVHRRRIPDEFRSAHFQRLLLRVPPTPLDSLSQTSPTAA